MANLFAAGAETDVRALGPHHAADALEEALRLAKLLSERVSKTTDEQKVIDVRLRLVRAQALSVVDLLTEILSDRARKD